MKNNNLKKCSVIGLGRMFHLHHNKNIKKNKFEIINIFDPREKLLSNVKKKLKIKNAYKNFSNFIDNSKTKIYFFFCQGMSHFIF